MKEIVNLTLRGSFYCSGKTIMFEGCDDVAKKLAAMLGPRIVRDGALRILLSEEKSVKERSESDE